jgi:hypothetical protein
MSLLDTYKQKLDAQIKEHKAQLDLLKARARRVAVQGKILGYEELAQADKHLDQARAKFSEFKRAGGSALGEFRIGVKKALADLKVSTKKAADHFQNHAPKVKATPPKPRARTKPAKAAKPAKATKSKKH